MTSLLIKQKPQKDYVVKIDTVMNGWLVTIWCGTLVKSVVVQTDGKDRISDVTEHVAAILEELERDVQ